MADYYPLLARALDALPDRTPALRKAVYDRARSALIGQLRSLEPPLPEADIDLERQALDTAIERLEADYGGPPAAVPAPPAKPEPASPEPLAPPAPKPEPPVAPPPPPLRDAPPTAPPPEPVAEARMQASAEPLPEPGPPPAFVPFVPPARKPRSEDAPTPPQAETDAGDAGPEGKPAEPAPAAPEARNGRQRPRLDVKPPRAGRSRQLRNLFVGGVLAAVISLIAAAAILLADKRADLPTGAEGGTDPSRPAPEAKLSDRVGGERAETEARPGVGEAGGRSDVAVAQRAVLYEENLSDPKATPAALQGRVTWRLEAVNGEQGQPLQSAVRANVEFPDAGLTLAMTLRKNVDASLPASHTLELAFTNYGPGEKRAVQEIGLIQIKDEESARGASVSGLPVRVRDNLFLIGLSNLPDDIERNTEMLTRRNWFDLPIRYKSGPRAIVTFEKGAAGTRIVQNAFDQWRE